MPQVHADASNFAEGVTKDDAYEQVLLQAEGLLYGQRNWVRQSPVFSLFTASTAANVRLLWR